MLYFPILNAFTNFVKKKILFQVSLKFIPHFKNFFQVTVAVPGKSTTLVHPDFQACPVNQVCRAKVDLTAREGSVEVIYQHIEINVCDICDHYLFATFAIITYVTLSF